MKKNIIQEKTFRFSLQIIKLYKILLEKKEFIISKQLLRSGTSIGANIHEAIRGKSKKDFIHTIALKKANETNYWLNLLSESRLIDLDYSFYIKDINEVIERLVKIIKTAKNNSSSPSHS